MFFKIRNLPSNLSIIEQLFAVLAGSIISKFIKPQCIFSGVEKLELREIVVMAFHGYTQRSCKIQEGRPNLKSGGLGLTY